MDINKVTLIGTVGDHVERKNNMATFSVATHKKFKRKNGKLEEHTTWHKIVCFGVMAEVAEKFVRKGKKVYVYGEIEGNYVVNELGVKVTYYNILAHEIISLSESNY